MGLTRKQKQVYDYIVDYIDNHTISPTQLEIKEHFGFKSLGSVQDYIKYLKNAEYLESDSNSVRGLIPKKDFNNSSANTIEIPMHGKVAAGIPIEALEGNESIAVPSYMVSKGSHYALTVSGESMIEDGILDGDIVIIKKQTHAHNGDTVVATLENEATIKRFYKKPNLIELHPANSSMNPIVIKEGDLQIKGILVGLYRTY